MKRIKTKTINKEELLNFMQQPAYRPMTADELAWKLKASRSAKFIALLHRLEKKGQIVVTQKGRYALPAQLHYITGRLQGHPRGFAFVIPEANKEQPTAEPTPDVYVRGEDLNGAMHQDQVVVRVREATDKGGRLEGEIIRVLERGNSRLVGTYQVSGRIGVVTPDEARINWDIFIAREDAFTAQSGDKVVVEITRWPEQRRSPEGKIVEVLGAKDTPGVDVLSIIRKYNLPEQFSKKVQGEVTWIAPEVAEEDLGGRFDLRHLPIVSIDGEDAKDLDDAVSVQVLPNGNYLLGVHIADVSHYVRQGSALDQEAARRGTSVYLVDRVIPMLPPELSNGICSLNPQVNRMTLSVFMEFDAHGERLAYSIFPSVIRTVERMTYTNVRKILLDKDPEVLERYAYLIEDFECMERLSKILRKRRFGRGALDFDLPECKVGLDDLGRPIDLYRYPRSLADEIIEEFMLAANETTATYMSSQRLPGIYRVHEDPDPAKLEEVNRSLEALGYSLPRGRKIRTRMFQQLLEQVEGRPEERVINTLLLRAMRHARYAPAPLGHFGLATKYYTHFTSPIRRYPDLIVHRILRASISEEGYFEPREWRPREDIRQHTGPHTSLSGGESAKRYGSGERSEAGTRQITGERYESGTRQEYDKPRGAGKRPGTAKRRKAAHNQAAGAEDFAFETAREDNADRLSFNLESPTERERHSKEQNLSERDFQERDFLERDLLVKTAASQTTADMTNESFLLLDQDKKEVLGKWFAKTGDAAKDAARNDALTWLSQNIPQIAEESSVRERAAEEAERESVEMKKVEYMQQHVGETFPGIVSGVTSFGMFVELENLVEGLVHVASLEDDYYVYVESPPSLIGERTKRRFRIGDPVQVDLVRVNVDQRQIDFELTS